MTNQVAETIIQQMGGKQQLIAMIGAHDFVRSETSIRFAFEDCHKATHCWIAYNHGSDAYIFELWKYNNKRIFNFNLVYKLENVRLDVLKPIFEEETGLYLSI